MSRDELRRTHAETEIIIPGVLASMPWAPASSRRYTRGDVGHLDQRYSAHFTIPSGDIEAGRPGTRIEVVDSDTYDAAIDLTRNGLRHHGTRDKRPVLVLNMANAHRAGGGWENGALAQEEALCYRSTLSATLKSDFYPLPELGGIYSSSVVVFRRSLAHGHRLVDFTNLKAIPVVSVISIAALKDPLLNTTTSPATFRLPQHREATKSRIRLILRVAAFNGHRRLVLGALGCGAFHNPPHDIVSCFREVFAEQEFHGGWWEKVVFAVMADKHTKPSNYDIFKAGLHGRVV